MIFQLFISAFLLLLGNPTLHEFHVSKCQVEYNTEDKAIQVTIHIYIDDLEEALRKRGADKLFLCTEREDAKAEEHLVAYLKDHFQIDVNNNKADFNFIGKERSEDLLATWCYLEFPNVDSLKKLIIENDLLMEVHADQKNIISIMMPGKQQGYFLFEKGKSVEMMEF